MRTFLYLLPALLFISCNQDPAQNTVNVIGQAQMKVVPDMVEISLRAYNVKPAMRDAVAATQLAINEILDVCRKYVSNPSDIKVSNISTNKAYEYNGNREVFLGYDAGQVLDITLKDIGKLEKFAEELLATKISRIDNIRYNHSRADSIMREVNLLALEDARQTASKMCGKMNVQLGSLIYLSNYELNERKHTAGGYNNYDVNLYNKSFGGRGFKMTAEILEFADAAFATFSIN